MIEMPSGASGMSTVERPTRCAPESCHSIVVRAPPGHGGPSGGLASRVHSPTSGSSRLSASPAVGWSIASLLPSGPLARRGLQGFRSGHDATGDSPPEGPRTPSTHPGAKGTKKDRACARDPVAPSSAGGVTVCDIANHARSRTRAWGHVPFAGSGEQGTIPSDVVLGLYVDGEEPRRAVSVQPQEVDGNFGGAGLAAVDGEFVVAVMEEPLETG